MLDLKLEYEHMKKDIDAAIAKLKERGVTFDIERPRRRFAGWRNSATPTGISSSFTNANQNE